MSMSELIAKYAPIVYFDRNEKYFPTNVDWFLERTALWVCDGSDGILNTIQVKNRPRQLDLLRQQHNLASGQRIFSDGSRSDRKRSSFFLGDLAKDQRGGASDPAEWTTYVHAYKNDVGGLTIQYWRFHAYNEGLAIPLPFSIPGLEFGYHGGDWEGVSIVLDTGNSPLHLDLLGHTSIEKVTWEDIEREGDHPVVFCERGGHATMTAGAKDGLRHETWGTALGGGVFLPNGTSVPAGGLLDVGSKLEPMSDQFFVQYSGLWGSPSQFPILGSDPYYFSSGYWGPAYNETELDPDGFITAWGKGTVDRQISSGAMREFYATDRCP